MMLEKRMENYLHTHNLIRSGECIFAGVSGGADSVCLLLLLKSLSVKMHFTLQAVHVNHNLRGEESDKDQRFVEELCIREQIPLYCFSYQVEDLAKKLRVSIEEAGREARKRAFAICREEHGAGKIALAHHRDDQAETLLFRLARGSSIGGLAGIRPVSGSVIHPLLFAGKEEILEELERRGQNWCMDSSNLTDHYTRNCIRQQVIPVLEERVNSSTIVHISEAAEDLAEADLLIRSLAGPLYQRTVSKAEAGFLLVKPELLTEIPILQRTVVLDALAELTGSRRNLGREQIRQILDILSGETGRRCFLPGGAEAVRTYQGLLLKQNPLETEELYKKNSGETDRKIKIPDKEKLSKAEDTEAKRLDLSFRHSCTFGRWQLEWEIFPGRPGEIPEKKYTKWLDYDKIKDSLEIRNRRSGDYLITTRTGGKKKLKEYFIGEKIPAEKRGEIPLLASGSRIFWVVGYRISEDCKITEQTERFVRIIIREVQNER